MMGLLLNSIALSVAVAAGCMIAGTLAAMLLVRRTRLCSALRLLFPVLLVVPPYLHAVIWTTCVFALNTWLGAHGMRFLRLDGWLGAWWAESMALLPLAVALSLLSLDSIDPALVEAGSTSRAPLAVLREIVIPLAAPYLAAGGGLLFLVSFLDYSVPSLFAVNVYALEIFSRYSADGQAATAALVSVPALLVSWLVLRSVLSPLRHAACTPHRRHAGATLRGPWPAWLSFARGGALALLAGQALVPLAWLSVMCGSVHTIIRVGSAARHEMAVTFQVAAACAFLAVVLGPVVAERLAARGRGAAFWWMAVCAAFAMPAPLVGVGAARIAGWVPVLRDGLWMPVWVNTTRFLPVAAFIVYAHLRRLDPLLLDAALLYQRSRLQGLLRVRLPLAMPALITAGAVCLVLPMGELGATIIVSPPGSPTLMMRLYNLLHYGESTEVAVICLLLMVLALAGAAAAMAAVRAAGRRAQAGDGREPTR